MKSTRRFDISRTGFARAEPRRAAQLISRPASWPSWQPEILSTDGPAEVEVGSVVRGRASMMGFEVNGTNLTTRVDEEAISQDAVVGVGMTITYEIRPVDEGVRITHRLVSDLPSGPLGWLLSLFLRKRLRIMQRDVLANLIAQLEEPSA